MQFDQLRRRDFIMLLGGAAAWPLAARAQQRPKVWRVGFLAGGSRPAVLATSIYGGFLRGMREIGLVVSLYWGQGRRCRQRGVRPRPFPS
jgi:putative ABC transport system substrate-binding protein